MSSGFNSMSFSVAVVQLWAKEIQNSLQSKSFAHLCTYLTFLIHIMKNDELFTYLNFVSFCLFTVIWL